MSDEFKIVIHAGDEEIEIDSELSRRVLQAAVEDFIARALAVCLARHEEDE